MITKDIKSNVSGVYVIRNTVNGKMYVGSSKNIRTRLTAHLNMLKKGIHHSIDLQVDFNEFGEDKFESEILIECPSSEARKYEEEYIDKLGLKQFGYNAGKIKKTSSLRYSLFLDELYATLSRLGYKANGKVYWFDLFEISRALNCKPTKILKNLQLDYNMAWNSSISMGNNEYIALNYDNYRGVQIIAFHSSCFDLTWGEREDVYIEIE